MTRTSLFILTILGQLCLLPSAWALDPETSTQVTESSLITISYKDSVDGATTYMGIDECIDAVEANEDVVARYTTTLDLNQVDINGSPYYKGSYYFEADRDATSAVTCSDTNCVTIDDDDVAVGTTSVDVTLAFNTLTGLTAAEDCQTGELDKEYFIRLTFDGGSTSTQVEEADVRIIVDGKRPIAPESFTATVTESSASISWVDDTPSEDLAGYAVFFSSAPIAGGTFPADTPNITLAGTVTVLTDEKKSGAINREFTPNATIYMSIATVDQAGNYSTLLASQPTTVLDTIDFWEAYKQSGGTEEGGYCTQTNINGSSAPHGAWLLLLVGAMIVRRRRHDLND